MAISQLINLLGKRLFETKLAGSIEGLGQEPGSSLLDWLFW